MISTGEALELVRNREDTDARIIRQQAMELAETGSRLRDAQEHLSRLRGLMDLQRVQLRRFGEFEYGEGPSWALCWEGTSIKLEPPRKGPLVISAADASLRMSM